MEPFTKLTAIAAPLPIINVDTDLIIPKQFLKTIKRTGLGIGLFSEKRYDDNGNPDPKFVLNRAPFDKAGILIAGRNFGCGSSREHAPWALKDFGFRCIIAPSFADIFYNNCFQNGMLPIVLDEDKVQALMEEAENQKNTPTFCVDLQARTITTPNLAFDFHIDPARAHQLLNGLDAIGLSLQKQQDIADFEAHVAQERPWV